ncbi:MAG: isopenicillin N synthase family oxygenase [Alphaproteobacteria bacterium]|nr:isopenicillin N synthase family oxygenase [Alphaproteobacteria bacterium]
MSSIPIIDVAPLATGTAAARAAVAQALGAACRTIGFFYITGHGIAPATLAATFEAARRFFALPVADKHTVSITRSPHNRGYVALQEERLDETKPADLKEAYNIGLDLPARHPEVLAGKPFRGVNLWPALPGWRDAVLAYFDAVCSVGRLLHRGFARDLGLAEDFFEDKLDTPLAVLRLLHYPPHHGPAAPGQIGAGQHTDYGNVTVLATDGVPGLEVRTRDGHWLEAPTIPGAFVCNIGDCLMRWTNDVYVSTPHRVALPTAHRFSIAFFLDPNPDAMVAALPGCVAADRPARYAPIRAADYLKARLDATYDHRKADQ